MPHHLMPNIFGARFSGQIIMLDVVRDRYIVLSRAQSTVIAPYLGIELDFFEASSPKNRTVLQELIEKCLVTEQVFSTIDPKLNPVSPSPQTGGMSANGWKLPNDAFKRRPAWNRIAKAIICLRSVHKQVSNHGLKGILKLLYTQSIRQGQLHFGLAEEYSSFMNDLNWACLFYPKATKCLEWSAALTLLCARSGFASKMIIGVQSFPFYAHAWSEIENLIVIGDSMRRRAELSVIFEFPTPLLEFAL